MNTAKQSRLTPLLLLILFLSTVIFLLFLPTQIFYLDGIFYSSLADDPMISMRYAKNWADGKGIYWNDGGSVAGYTNFLFVFIMAVVHKLALSQQTTSLYVILFNGVVNAATIVLTYFLTVRMTHSRSAGLGAAAIYGFAISALALGSLGYETTTLSFFAISSVLAIVYRKLGIASILLALGVLTRDDFTIFVFCIGVMTSALASGKMSHKIGFLLRLVLVPLIAYVSLLTFRYFYYGDMLPNTYYLKATGWPSYQFKYLSGLRYLESMIPVLGLTALTGIALSIEKACDRKSRSIYLAIALAVLAFAIYVVSVGGDNLGPARLFAPLFPFFAVFSATLIYVRKWYPRERPLTLLFILAIAVAYPATFGLKMKITQLLRPYQSLLGYIDDGGEGLPRRFKTENLKEVPPYYVNNLSSCLLIRQDAAARNVREPSLAVYFAGVPPYFCHEMRAVDLLGKSDSVLAKQKADVGVIGHNKYNYDHSLGELRPTYILSLIPSINSLSNKRYLNQRKGPFNFHLLARNKEFQQCYGANYLRPTNSPIFVRGCEENKKNKGSTP